MHQHYSAEVAKVLAQLNSEDRKTTSSKVERYFNNKFQLHLLVYLSFRNYIAYRIYGHRLQGKIGYIVNFLLVPFVNGC